MYIDYSQKQKSGCYCVDCQQLGENQDGATVCFNCGIVIDRYIIDFSDETVNYTAEDEKVSRCNGYSKKSYMSESSNLQMDNNTKFSKYISNMMLWSSYTYEDIAVLNVKKMLEEKSQVYGFNNNLIENILVLYKNLLNMKTSTGERISFKGRYKRGLLAVFAYISNSELSLETILKIFEINDISTFNKCCKIFKDLFKREVTIHDSKIEKLYNFLNKLKLSHKEKILIKKGYNVCVNYAVFSNMETDSSIICIIYLFLMELDSPVLENCRILFQNVIKNNIFDEKLLKLQEIKYSIFNDIKNM